MGFVAKQHLHHDQFGYMVVGEEDARCLGGFGANYYRPWVYPLYTPNGLTVLQEFPYDHPFHNGFWVGQGPLRFEGREVHFWPAPPERRPGEPLFAHMGRMQTDGPPEIKPGTDGVRFRLDLVWRDGQEQPVVDEERLVHLYRAEDATVCDMTSIKTSAYGHIEYQETKFGSICVRVEPRLLPLLGGEILADGGRRGAAEVANDRDCDFVAYENQLPGGGRFGICLASLDEGARGPWFVRDYGMACYSPTRVQSIHVASGDRWTAGMRVVAYDGALTEERARRWLAL